MRKVIISGMIGNALEWYDYALYAEFAHIIGKQFFPNSEIQEILTFAVFAAGFFIRPVGAVVFGNIGDRMGRRFALMLGILTMAIPTAAIGLLPSYNSIGIAAPLLLVLIRLIQGFSLGGEFSGCITYLVEYSQPGKRGLIGSAAFVSMCLGMLLGNGTASLMANMMDEANLVSWGWRIPFIAGLFVGLVGLYIRHNLSESPLYRAAKAKKSLSSRPLYETVTQYWKSLVLAIAIYITVTAPFYTATVFIKSFLLKLGYSNLTAIAAGTIILISMTIIMPISSAISDKIGRKKVLLIGATLVATCSYLVFYYIGKGNDTIALIACFWFSLIVGFYMGPV
ncbi:MAG: MFS transporter, partial [Rickettsiaceae bacterium]|nr:MFS transporter [Rickettsiaceae bacterium]